MDISKQIVANLSGRVHPVHGLIALHGVEIIQGIDALNQLVKQSVVDEVHIPLDDRGVKMIAKLYRLRPQLPPPILTVVV